MDTPAEPTKQETQLPEQAPKGKGPGPNSGVRPQKQPKGAEGETGNKSGKTKPVNTNTSKRGRKKGVIEVEPTSGCRDFYPEEMRVRNYLFDAWRYVAKAFGFQEFDAPIVEDQELYCRKGGEEIKEQMFAFQTKDGYNVALRPEMTPSVARLIMKTNGRMVMPIKWFSIPQCWRFETVCRGRQREHYQWNMDIFGAPEISAEAELLAAVVMFFKRVGVTSKDVVIRINSRQVLQQILEPLGVTGAQFAPVCVIVDKLDKLEECEVTRQLAALEPPLKPEIIATIKSTLSIKSLDELKTILPDSSVVKDFEQLWALAKAYGYDDWIQFDASIVRGLSYYTGIVFEAKDRKGVLRAISGGGRYDKLLSTYGAKNDIPACGFGFGDCVIVELLKELKLLPELGPATDDLIIAFNEELRPAACQVANKLRAQGRSVDVQLLYGKNVGWCYKYADRIGAKRAVFVAPKEWAEGCVRIKELRLAQDVETKEFDVKFEEL